MSVSFNEDQEPNSSSVKDMIESSKGLQDVRLAMPGRFLRNQEFYKMLPRIIVDWYVENAFHLFVSLNVSKNLNGGNGIKPNCTWIERAMEALKELGTRDLKRWTADWREEQTQPDWLLQKNAGCDDNDKEELSSVGLDAFV